MQDAKNRVATLVEGRAEQLVAISHEIWDVPELCFEEHTAHRVLTDAIEAAGFDVEREAFGLPTAFRATIGTEGPTVAICCEYDALPGLGHACGHNVIAAAGLGAGLAAAKMAAELGGRVVILGTPAEEGGGGKVYMIERGALDGVDAAMMVHPADAELDSFWAIAIHELHCTYRGVAAHAAAAPHKGVNALDAAVLGYQGVGLLRQHIASHERIHGIFTEAGAKPNIVPDIAKMEWYVRSGSTATLRELEPRVLAALEAGALATGAQFEFEWQPGEYQNMVDNRAMLAAYAANLSVRGRTMRSKSSRPEFLGSTDMGNVSHNVPSIHPMIQIAPPGVPIHTPDFATHARGAAADQAIVDGAVAMAQTVVDLWCDPSQRDAAQSEFDHAERSPGRL